MANFYGIDGIEVIWHGEWNDPEISYDGFLFDYYDIESALYMDYDLGHELDETFSDWIMKNKDNVYGLLDDIIVNRIKSNRIDVSDMLEKLKTFEQAASELKRSVNAVNDKILDFFKNANVVSESDIDDQLNYLQESVGNLMEYISDYYYLDQFDLDNVSDIIKK